MKKTWCHNSILGITVDEMVMLDFDNTTFRTVRYWSRRAMNCYKLGGFLILKSSEGCYHVVFNRGVSWSENMRIIAWITLQAHNKDLQRWQLMQCIKQSSTLRISPKGDKLSPRIVYREGKQDDQIEDYLEYRKLIKKIIKKLS